MSEEVAETKEEQGNMQKALETISSKLKEIGVDYGVTGGLAAKAYGSDREVHDIDIFFVKRDSDRIVEAFKEQLKRGPAKEEKKYGSVWNIYFKIEGVTVEFISNAIFDINGRTYSFHPSFQLFKRVKDREIDSTKIKVLSPEDIVILKSITQRGQEDGKHDIDDILSICKNTPLDVGYLKRRAFNCNAQDRVVPFLKSLK